MNAQKEILWKIYTLTWPLKHKKKWPPTPDINEYYKFFLKSM